MRVTATWSRILYRAENVPAASEKMTIIYCSRIPCRFLGDWSQVCMLWSNLLQHTQEEGQQDAGRSKYVSHHDHNKEEWRTPGFLDTFFDSPKIGDAPQKRFRPPHAKLSPIYFLPFSPSVCASSHHDKSTDLSIFLSPNS